MKRSMMQSVVFFGLLLIARGDMVAAEAAPDNTLTAAQVAEGWQLLFDGRTLTGWKASENPDSFAARTARSLLRGAAP